MNISNTFARNRTLGLVVAISLGLHVLALLIFGAFKIAEIVAREEATFVAPEIAPPPQEEPEYVVNLEQRNQSSAPPRPNPIVVESPDVSIPALNIDVNIANSSAYGRGTGGFGTGVNDMREMALDIDKLSIFGKEMRTDAQRMLFVIDVSGSMIMKERGYDGYKIVAAEIVRVLRSVEGFGTFNIVAFGGEVDKFRGSSFVLASTDMIESAKVWLARRDPARTVDEADVNKSKIFKGIHLGTETGQALEDAFKMRPNMIVLLSDGKPSGKMKEEQIHKFVAKAQSDPKIPINTISYKSNDGREFLKKLADDNAGTYTEIK